MEASNPFEARIESDFAVSKNAKKFEALSSLTEQVRQLTDHRRDSEADLSKKVKSLSSNQIKSSRLSGTNLSGAAPPLPATPTSPATPPNQQQERACECVASSFLASSNTHTNSVAAAPPRNSKKPLFYIEVDEDKFQEIRTQQTMMAPNF